MGPRQATAGPLLERESELAALEGTLAGPRKPKAVAVMVAILLCVGVPLRAAPASGDAPARAGYPVLVYESSRPGLSVSITRKGDRMTPVSIGGPANCEDGSERGTGFSLIGTEGIPVAAGGTFDDHSHSDRIFRGHFAGDKVIGVFKQSHIEVGGDPDSPDR